MVEVVGGGGALVLDELINTADGAPATAPTLNTIWEVQAYYDDSVETVAWRLQEQNASITYTTGTHTVTNGYELIVCDSTDGNVTVNMPDPTTKKGRRYYFKNKVAAHVTTINAGSFLIDGSATYVLGTNYATVTLISDGVQWWVV